MDLHGCLRNSKTGFDSLASHCRPAGAESAFIRPVARFDSGARNSGEKPNHPQGELPGFRKENAPGLTRGFLRFPLKVLARHSRGKCPWLAQGMATLSATNRTSPLCNGKCPRLVRGIVALMACVREDA